MLFRSLVLLQGIPSGTADDTDWADCLACHQEIDTGLPALSPLRPATNAPGPRSTCNSCHSEGVPSFSGGDWSHPVRSIGEHIGCENCHPAVPHSAEFPPPVPKGDYHAEQCFACHADVARHLDLLSSHMGPGLTRCIDCHPPHEPMRAFIPDPLLPLTIREDRGSYNRIERSNAPCMECHSRFDLFTETREGFVTVNTENYHRLHVVERGIGCIECHDAHGSTERFMMRPTLLTGEVLSFIPGLRGATCSIRCHGADHNFTEYVNRLP